MPPETGFNKSCSNLEHGDILVFMPGERDIHETQDLVQGRVGTAAEIIPLFGRLSTDDQQRVLLRRIDGKL